MFGEVENLRDALVQIVLRLRDDVLRDSVDRQNSEKDGNLTVATTDPLYASSYPLPALLPYRQQITPLGYDHRGDIERGLEVYPRSSSYGYSSLQVHHFSLTSIILVSPLVFILNFVISA